MLSWVKYIAPEKKNKMSKIEDLRCLWSLETKYSQ